MSYQTYRMLVYDPQHCIGFCSGRKCEERPTHIACYDVQASQYSAHMARRFYCDQHAEHYAKKYKLAWPAPHTSVNLWPQPYSSNAPIPIHRKRFSYFCPMHHTSVPLYRVPHTNTATGEHTPSDGSPCVHTIQICPKHHVLMKEYRQGTYTWWAHRIVHQYREPEWCNP